jgi:Fic family protein
MDRLGKRITGLDSKIIEEIYSLIAEIDAAKASWRITNSVAPQVIERLTESTIIASTGASNRIDGNNMSDDEVKSIYQTLNTKKLKTREEQEIAGYIEILQFMFDNHEEIIVSESNILWLHKEMQKYCNKDEKHKGSYKNNSNHGEARERSGNVAELLDLTPAHLVRKEISELVDWYNEAINSKHPLIVTANFIFEYLAIHPFQDGNGRISRLLSNLMLLHNEYLFTRIISHEQIIETNKIEYHSVLNYTQTTWKTNCEDVSQWILFFLKIVKTQAKKIVEIMQTDNFEQLLSEKQLVVWNYILSRQGEKFSRKDVMAATSIAGVTIGSIIKKLLNMNKIMQLGQGRATAYKQTFHSNNKDT